MESEPAGEATRGYVRDPECLADYPNNFLQKCAMRGCLAGRADPYVGSNGKRVVPAAPRNGCKHWLDYQETEAAARAKAEAATALPDQANVAAPDMPEAPLRTPTADEQ